MDNGDVEHAHEARVRLADGRSLGYRASGDARGTPLLFLHGFPGSRFQCPDDGYALERGVRLIAVERPGYGLSDPPPEGYSLAAWARDVAAFADALEIERFAVAGFSLGGMFALACAHELPRRVLRVGLIGSVAPLDVPGNWDGLGDLRGLYELARTDVATLQSVVATMAASPEALVDAIAASSCPVDRALIADARLRAGFLRDAGATLWRSGPRFAVGEIVLAARPWGFDLANVRVPAILWQGQDDVTAPPAMGRYLAAAIPDCRAYYRERQGHLLMCTLWREILASLID